MTWEHLQGKTEVISVTEAILVLYYLSDREVVLIDSGKVREPDLFAELSKRNLSVRAILCTHLHRDHIANNAELIQRYGAVIYAGEEDVKVASSDELFMKVYGAEDVETASQVRKERYPYPICAVSKDADYIDIDGASFRIIQTPGHSRGHMAIVTPDNVCCVGDTIISKDVLDVSKLPYMEDVNRSIVSMEKLKETDYPFYAIAHKAVVKGSELHELVDENVRKEIEIYSQLRNLIREPIEEDDLIVQFLNHLRILRSDSPIRPALIRMAKSRIVGLLDAGECRLEGTLVCPVKYNN